MRKLQRVDVVAMYQNDRLALPQGGACGCATGRHRPACDDTGHAAQSAHRPLSQHQQARQPSCSTGRVAFRTAAHWTWHPIQSAPCHRTLERQGIVSQQQLESGQSVCVFQGNWPFWSSTPQKISGLAGRLVEGASDKTISLFSCMWHLSATLYGILTPLLIVDVVNG